MELHKSGDVDLWLFDDLDLADIAIVDWVDWADPLFNIFSNGVRQEFGDESSDVSVLDFLVDSLYHFLSDELDLLRLGVGGFLLLVLLFLGKGNDENSEVVVVGGFDIDVHVDHGVPFFDHGADLVSGQRHTVEVEHAVFALYVFADKFEFAEGVRAVAVKITLVNVLGWNEVNLE